MKDENLVPKRLYNVHLLNDDIQKQNQEFFTAENIKISASGALEADRIWQDVPFTTKIFYMGPYFISELSPEEAEHWYDQDDCDHNHDMESGDDD
jgi:hypothetical protein